MQLRAVLDAFESGQTFTLPQLARQLNVEPGVLEDMIQFWVKKGKLREVSSSAGCATCGLHGGCPVVTTTGPRRYELASSEPIPVLNCQRPQ